jgi:hypothetical protein
VIAVTKRYSVIGAVGPQDKIRLFWLIFTIASFVWLALDSGVIPVVLIAFALAAVLLGTLARKRLKGSWYIETDDNGFTVSFGGNTYIWYDDLKPMTRNGDDVTMVFWQKLPLSIIPVVTLSRSWLKLKVADAQSFLEEVTPRIREAPPSEPFTHPQPS